MDPNSDHDSHDPGPDEQKVRVQSGTTGAKMAAEGPQQQHSSSERGGAPARSDITTNNSPSTNYTTTTTTTTSDDRRHLINRDDFSGLQVVEPGLEVPHSTLPEALPPSDPQTQYVEYKGWDDHSPPPQAVHPSQNNLSAAGGGGGGGYPFPEAVSPGGGGDNLHSPVSQPYSKTSSATYNGGHNPFETEKQQRPADRRICGMRRMVFWCVLAVAIFVVVAGVAVGVGVGLGTRDDSSSSNSTSTPATSTHSVPSATATAVASPSASIICPYANRTVYSLESTADKNFLVLCGRDYNSCCGAVDMVTINSTTFEDCLERCGAQEGCTAVGWGNYYGINTCWLKSAWGEPNWSGSWYAAVLTDSI